MRAPAEYVETERGCQHGEKPISVWNPSVPHQNRPGHLSQRKKTHESRRPSFFCSLNCGSPSRLAEPGSLESSPNSHKVTHSSEEDEVFVPEDPGSVFDCEAFAHHLHTQSYASEAGNCSPA